MKPGYYDATLKQWALHFMGDSGFERPVCEITFNVATDEGIQEFRYRGWLSEKAKAYTVKDLVTLGFKDTTLEHFAKGKAGNALDTSKTYRVKVVAEEFKGKTYFKVKGIYPLQSKREQQYDSIAASQAAKTIDIAAEVLAARGGTKAPATVAPVGAGGLDDLPF